MLSKEQAEHVADALLAGARAERERAAARRTRLIVKIYPRLKGVPAVQRHAALRDAMRSADAHGSGRLLQALLIVAFGAFLAFAWADRSGVSSVFGWAAVVFLLAWQLQRQILTRRFIRAALRSEEA